MSGFLITIFDSREKPLVRALHIFVLWGFAVAQPLYDIFAQYADFFVAHQAKPLDVVLLAATLSFGLPLLLVLPLFVADSINKKLAAALYHGVLGVLAMLLALLFLKKVIAIPDIYVIALAVLIAMGFLYIYLGFQTVRSLMTWIGISIVIFPAQFLTFSSVQQIVFPEKTVGQAAHTVDSEVPVIFVVFEELPLVSLLDETHSIDSVRYPNFNTLGQKSHWFRNYTVNAAKTNLSVPTILTGNYAAHRKVMVLKNYQKSLFTLLHPTYRIVGEGLSAGLIPKKFQSPERAFHQLSLPQRVVYMLLDMSMVYLHMIVPSSLASVLPPVTDNWNNFFDPEAPSTGLDAQQKDAANAPKRNHQAYYWKGAAFNFFMESLSNASEPTLYFLHTTYAHNPWNYSTSGRHYGDKRLPGYLRDKSTVNAVFGFGGGRWGEDEWLVTQGHQRHLLEVSYIDTMLGELMQRLEDLDMFDKSLIIVTSDHGASFEAGARNRGHLETVAGDTMAVPLFIKLPFQTEGAISDDNTESIDLLPTIADILDIDLVWPVDGQSLFDESAVHREQKTLVFPNENKKLDRLLVSGANEPRDLRLQYKLSIFGSGHTRPKGYYRIGQYGDLVGRKAVEFPVVADSEESVTIQFNEHGLFADVDPGNPVFIPVRVSGSIVAGATDDGPVYLAVAINGKIEATTRTFRERSSDRPEFYAMIAEEALKKGSNDVNFFVITADEDSGVRLSPVIEAKQ